MLLVVLSFFATATLYAQETVFNSLGNNLKRADKYFTNQNYIDALELYLAVEKKGKAGNEIYLKLARTYHNLHQSDLAVMWYEKYLYIKDSLEPEDQFIYAESLISTGSYEKAIMWLKKYQAHGEDSREIIEKIWRLQNIQHLYADSAYYEVNPIDINSEFAEFGPTYDGDHLIFVSNRKANRGISKVDQLTGHSFQSLYSSELEFDSSSGSTVFSKPTTILRDQHNGLHFGASSVQGDRMLFTRSAMDKVSGKSNLQLYWAQKIDDKWVGGIDFQHNSNGYSLSHPTLSTDGNTLFFVSDMPGGMGGKDIYRCNRNGNEWSQPQNLGRPVNTAGDETAPFFHEDNTLYFASSGHGGFGGLDIFKASLNKDQIYEVENMGYPVNTKHDDFGLILNREGTAGFMASNRRSGGFDDDLYEVAVDLQTYPLVITGRLSYHDPDWNQASRLEILPSAKLTLIDHRRALSVFETTSDHDGGFELEIPYSSQYMLRVSSDLIGESTVSLEIPKNRKYHTDHEIVVIKEKFKDLKPSPEAESSNKSELILGSKQRTRK